ncbi:MAG: DUF4870 family protein [Thiolinea sp.]
MNTEPATRRTTSAETVATIVYALHAASFLLGFTAFIAIIINYIKRGEARGTWLESHFRWQIRTFWYSLLWTIIGVLTIVFVIGYAILGLNFIWLIYRVAKGWLRLADGKAMYTLS